MNDLVLINLFDEHNENSLIAIDIYNPKKVIFLVEKKDYELYKLFEIKCKEFFRDLIYVSLVIDNNFLKIIEKELNGIKNNIIANVTGGRRVYSLLLLDLAIKNRLDSIYIDVLNKELYKIGRDISREYIKIKDLYIEDLLLINGSKVIMDSTNLSNNNKIIEISKKIYNNLEIWHEYKHKLYNNNIFVHDVTENSLININFKMLNEEEKTILNRCLNYLKELSMIEFKLENEKIEVRCLNDYIKGFVFKSGTWLEVLMDVIIREIREIDQVKNGVMFLWKDDQKIKNELDIVAVKDSVLICVSCKDSNKYDEAALNELEVYSNRIGGKNTKKILAATKEPLKKCVTERAQEMGINLLIIDRDINKLKKQIVDIIGADELN